jgi:predicted N-formylglutamate amidohydrolase
MSVEERLDLIEFRQELLFENSAYSRLLFEYNITREQYNAIMDLMDEYRNMIESNEEVHHGSFEQRIYNIVPQHDGSYHFAEAIAQENHRRGSWEEVFVTLYGGMPKFQSYMQSNQ